MSGLNRLGTPVPVIWGKAPQAHTGENGEGDIKVTIRHILEHIDDKPVVIDGRCVEIDTTVVEQPH